MRWSFYATVEAEELGITQANVDKLKAESKDPAMRALQGSCGMLSTTVGMMNVASVAENAVSLIPTPPEITLLYACAAVRQGSRGE